MTLKRPTIAASSAKQFAGVSSAMMLPPAIMKRGKIALGELERS